MSHDILSIISGLVGLFVVLFSTFKIGIKDYFKNRNELETLKEKVRNVAIEKLSEEVASLKIELKNIKSEIINFQDVNENSIRKLLVIESNISKINSQIVDTMTHLIEVKNNVTELVKKEVKTQVVQLTHDIMMFKQKNVKNKN